MVVTITKSITITIAITVTITIAVTIEVTITISINCSLAQRNSLHNLENKKHGYHIDRYKIN